MSKGLGLRCLLDGASLHATARITSVSRATGAKLASDARKVFTAFQDRVMRGLPCQSIEIDEVWTFVYSKGQTMGARACPVRAARRWGCVDVGGHRPRH